jgi:hypothetical protein
MKSKLQNGDVCTHNDGLDRIKKENWFVYEDDPNAENLLVENYREDLTRKDGVSDSEIIKITRKGKIIWQRNEPIDINKMMTVEINGETYPLLTHENMRILVEKISELEKEIINLKQAK